MEERAARRAADEDKAHRLGIGNFEEFLQRLVQAADLRVAGGGRGLLGRTIAARRRNDPGELARSLRGMGTGSQPSLWGELEDLSVPALAVAGELDDQYTRVSSRMAEISPRMKSTVVPGAGHTVHAEAPEVFISLLVDFLDRLPLALGEAEPVP